MGNEDIDAMPANTVAQKEEEKEEKPPLPDKRSSWKVYLKPYWWSLLLSHNRLCYGLNLTFWYLAQFIGAVACINLYSDGDRTILCAGHTDPDKASEVLDFPLVLLAVFHMIEWIRTSLLLTVSCIGVNWSIGWYATTLNTLYGIIAYAIAHMAYLSEDGKDCGEVQEYRYAWLLAEIVAFWFLFFIYSFPFIFSICMGKDKADQTLEDAYKEDEEEDDD